jgi:transcriptional regulator with XRE-family HTH domain
MNKPKLPHGLDGTLKARARRRRVALAFGTVLKVSRRSRELSQEKLAELCDFDRSYPSLLERGLRTPTLTVLLELANGLNVPAESLVAETAEAIAKTSSGASRGPDNFGPMQSC